MSNRIQLRRSATPGYVPSITDVLLAELVINTADDNLYYSDGSKIVQANAAANIRTDELNRFVTDADITKWNTPRPAATTEKLGEIIVGNNLQVEVDGTLWIKVADTETQGVLSSTDWNTFNNKQDDLGYAPVDRAGDTMTGALVLPGAPTADNEASNKKYVDDGLAKKVNLDGGTMTGLLVLSGAPTAGLGAATKSYVDTAVSNISGSYASPVQAVTDLVALPSNVLQDKQLRLVEDTGVLYRYDAQSTEAVSGNDVVAMTASPEVGRWFKVQSVTQSHDLLYGIQGGAEGDYIHLTTEEKNSYDSHLLDTDLHVTASQSLLLDGLNVSSTELNYMKDVTSSVQEQLDGKEPTLGFTPLDKAGGTMTGTLTLAADPTTSMEAATKGYVDSLVIDCGQF